MNLFKRLVICGVEWANDAVSLSVELIGDITKLFLSSSVPYLDLYSFIVVFIEVFGCDKVNGDSLLMATLELSVIDTSE